MYNYTILESILFPPTIINDKQLRAKLAHKTILITGASSGIGEQLVYQLGNIECHLVLVARRWDKLQNIKRLMEQQKADVMIYQADLRNAEELQGFLSYLNQLSIGIDVFVNNAGLSIKRSIFDSLDRFHDFSRTMSINYEAPVQILLSIIPILEKSRGHIINISTVNALLNPFPNFAAYQASKLAFDTWLRSASPELQARGIATTSVYLPLVRTPMIEPTVVYHNMPAMSPLHVATIVCKLMYTRKKRKKPWWIFIGQFFSFFYRA
ncbi:SDR family NAD(P)-dependent oxidoreductase [Ornithinibacillus xuwenensis]|uniref:SDR family NAD(P)-dependent oxidoreductase n=1 Tax=Ornithinibacillus xuwenensis TaxID=3144668 RepID=A0ABU9XEN3_9BACI